MKEVLIVYFSGTGCTRLVAETFHRLLGKRGIQSSLRELRHDSGDTFSEYERLVICFPVHACNAPEPLFKWVKRQPFMDGKPAAVISVSGGGEVTPNLASRVSLIRALKRRGFSVDYEKMLVMPSNWIVPTEPVVSSKLLELLPKKISFILDELDTGVRRRSKPMAGNRILSILGNLEKTGARSFGKSIKADGNCTSCGICVKRCPVDNIELSDGRPVFRDKCLMCLGCIYACPQKALSPGKLKFVTIDGGFDLSGLTVSGAFSPEQDLMEKTAGWLWAGVRSYILDKSDIAD